MDDYGASTFAAGLKSGRDSINAFDPSAKSNNFLQNYNANIGQQQGQARSFQQEFADTIARNPQMTDAYNTANEKYNIGGLSQNANTLNNQLNSVVPNAYKQMRGFDAGDAQVQQQAMVNSRFLAPAANAAQANLNTASGLASGYVAQQQAQNEMNVRPIEQYGEMLNDSFARQSTGYTTAFEGELSGLMEKMKSGVALSQAEMDRANQLAKLQNDYRTTMDQQKLANQGALANTIQGQQYQTLNPGQSLINTFAQGVLNPATGKVRKY